MLQPPLLETIALLPSLLFLLFPFLFLRLCYEVSSHGLLGDLLPRRGRGELPMRLGLRMMRLRRTLSQRCTGRRRLLRWCQTWGRLLGMGHGRRRWQAAVRRGHGLV